MNTTTGNSKVLCVPMHSYYDMGVAMVDCVIVIIVYTLHVWGPLEVQLFIVHTLGYQEKATETICSWNLMVESVAPCLHSDP